MSAVVQILGDVPSEVVRDFLQHIRDFDARHAGCHFKMSVVTNTSETAQELAAVLQSLDPPFTDISVINLGGRPS